MSRVRVASFSISIDGFGAGPDQSLAHPLGVGGEALHGWIADHLTADLSVTALAARAARLAARANRPADSR